MRKIIALSVLGLLGISVSLAAKADDEVKSLPDCPPLPSKWYSGYLAASATKSLHYVFIESLDSPTTDPVVIWFNGGPGCSSLLGLFQENGPFVIDDGETIIKPNPEPWNKRANLLYIESPAGVGFSVANGTNDTNHTDMSQSKDTFAAVKNFYSMFPEFLQNDLYVSGESYAGVYVPYLVWQIHQWNQKAKLDSTGQTQIYPIKGFMVGNGATNWNYDADANYAETFGYYNVIPQSLMQTYLDNNCHNYWSDVKPPTNNTNCSDAYNSMMDYVDGLNIYDLFRKNYDISGILKSGNRLESTMVNGQKKTYKVGYTMQEYTPWVKRLHKEGVSHPILGAYTTSYLNREDVRTALNIPADVQAWEECTGVITYNTFIEGSEWIYPILKAYGYKLMHYSGDTDGAVGTLGTKKWIAGLNFDVTGQWRQWHTDGNVSGFHIDYDNFKFVTVHGVGHMAPQWKRKDVTQLISKYIHNELID